VAPAAVSAVAAAVLAAVAPAGIGSAAYEYDGRNSMKDPVNTFLTTEAQQQIEEHIRDAEKITSGEIVVKVVSSSDGYAKACLLGGFIVSLLLAISAMLIIGSRDMWMFLGVFAALFVAMHELIRQSFALKRLFVSSAEKKIKVEEAAISAFYRRGIDRTVDHTGVLVYISIFEHRVRVVADKGINEKVEQEVWQEIVDMIVRGVHEQSQAEALCRAVDRCGAILASHFPRKQGDRNELADSIIFGRAAGR
jgi:putative membrane protein